MTPHTFPARKKGWELLFAQSLQLKSEPASDGMVHIYGSQRREKNKPKLEKKNNNKRKPSIKISSLHCVETFRGLQEHVKNLYKLKGRKPLAAQVLQKGQGLTPLDRSAEWEQGCYVPSSQAVLVIKRRTIYFKGLTEPVAWMAEEQQVQGKWEGPVKERKKPQIYMQENLC